jgi:hypothetical protein
MPFRAPISALLALRVRASRPAFLGDSVAFRALAEFGRTTSGRFEILSALGSGISRVISRIYFWNLTSVHIFRSR